MMKVLRIIQLAGLTIALCLGVFAQDGSTKKRERIAKSDTGETVVQDGAGSSDVKPDAAKTDEAKSDAKTDAATQTGDGKELRTENQSEEEAAVIPYYNNYLKQYRLGPEDIISVEVFGQPAYSKSGIIIPPTATISYPLIPGGVFVGGKTVDQIAAEIHKKLDEYIIDPNVTVTLERVGSARYSVLGKVATPGVKLMTRRYNVYEAVVEAGGFARDGDKKRVLLIRQSPEGFTRTVIDFDKLLTGKTEIPYLVPGDQIIVPEKKWSLNKLFDVVGKASAFRILFGVPF
jgi:protein involved in polysaccharide export with SLBB domain